MRRGKRVEKQIFDTAELQIVVLYCYIYQHNAMLLWNIYFFLYFKTENKSVNVWRKEMLQSVYPLYTFPDNIYFVYVPGKNTFEPKINYLFKVFLRLTEKFLRISSAVWLHVSMQRASISTKCTLHYLHNLLGCHS